MCGSPGLSLHSTGRRSGSGSQPNLTHINRSLTENLRLSFSKPPFKKQRSRKVVNRSGAVSAFLLLSKLSLRAHFWYGLRRNDKINTNLWFAFEGTYFYAFEVALCKTTKIQTDSSMSSEPDVTRRPRISVATCKHDTIRRSMQADEGIKPRLSGLKLLTLLHCNPCAASC